ncbi:hypothetical protein B484DRAFT_406834 [Ochromonadaceae sp. CCMP2298]|nr:hypothetical protein B484DRAFT_406834 [Ochromonadaceae sp. CCMP2298]
MEDVPGLFQPAILRSGVKFRDLRTHAFSPAELTWLCAEMDNQNGQFKTGVPFVEAEVCSEPLIDGISVRKLEAQFGTGESDLCDIDAALLVEMEKTSRRRAAKGGALAEDLYENGKIEYHATGLYALLAQATLYVSLMSSRAAILAGGRSCACRSTMSSAFLYLARPNNFIVYRSQTDSVDFCRAASTFV